MSTSPSLGRPRLPIDRKLKLHSIPRNGMEFLLQTRLEAAAAAEKVYEKRMEEMSPSLQNERTDTEQSKQSNRSQLNSTGEDSYSHHRSKSSKYCGAEIEENYRSRRKSIPQEHIIKLFLSDHDKLLANKEALRRKFPKSVKVPLKDKKKCCLFCLGGRKYFEVYKDTNPGGQVKPHLPLLSIVVHLRDEEIAKLLEYLFDWSSVAEINGKVLCWIYALLICLENPITDENILGILESLYSSCSFKYFFTEEALEYPYHKLIASLATSFHDL